MVGVLVLGGRWEAAVLASQAGVALGQDGKAEADGRLDRSQAGAAAGLCVRVTGHERYEEDMGHITGGRNCNSAVNYSTNGSCNDQLGPQC